jgi:hypothetical protein
MHPWLFVEAVFSQLQTRLIGIAFLLRNLKIDNAPGITLGSREASVNAWAG